MVSGGGEALFYPHRALSPAGFGTDIHWRRERLFLLLGYLLMGQYTTLAYVLYIFDVAVVVFTYLRRESFKHSLYCLPCDNSPYIRHTFLKSIRKSFSVLNIPFQSRETFHCVLEKWICSQLFNSISSVHMKLWTYEYALYLFFVTCLTLTLQYTSSSRYWDVLYKYII